MPTIPTTVDILGLQKDVTLEGGIEAARGQTSQKMHLLRQET